MSTLDPRLHAYRADLAAASLRERVSAPRYVAGTSAQVVRGAVDLRREPAATAPLDTQLLCGERVAVYDEADGWAWVQNAADGYVGYVDGAALGRTVQTPTHEVATLRTFLYPEPNLKAPPLDHLSMTSPVAVVATRDRFSEVRLATGHSGWIYSRHLAAVAETAPDYVATARQFLGVPYLWGGKTSLGLDCSGLVQLALTAAGIRCPRDSDMQEALGIPVATTGDLSDLRRGDLVFWKGHVAIARDGKTLVHANAFHMAVAIEPAADAIARLRAMGSEVTSVKRIER